MYMEEEFKEYYSRMVDKLMNSEEGFEEELSEHILDTLDDLDQNQMTKH